MAEMTLLFEFLLELIGVADKLFILEGEILGNFEDVLHLWSEGGYSFALDFDAVEPQIVHFLVLQLRNPQIHEFKSKII